MGVIPPCLGIVLFLFTFFTAASPIVAAGYPDAFVRATAIAPEMMQSEPAVKGIAIQQGISQKSRPKADQPLAEKFKIQNIRNNQKNNQLRITNNQPVSLQAVTDAQPINLIMAAISRYRQSKGLSTVNSERNTCAFARTRAAEIAENFSHDGFTRRILDKTLPYSSYTTVTENIAQTNDPQKVITLWVNSPGHEKNLTADTPYICVESSGSYYAMEGWKP